MGLLSDDRPSQEELQREQQRNQEDLQNITQADRAEGVDPDYVRMMVDSELQDGTATMLANLLSRDWVLGQMSDAETHEARWLARTMVDELEAMHPAEDSIWTGELRRYAADDPTQQLRPLNAAQKLEIFEFIQGFIARVSRSREGFQQEIFRKQIRKSEREDRTEDESGGWI